MPSLAPFSAFVKAQRLAFEHRLGPPRRLARLDLVIDLTPAFLDAASIGRALQSRRDVDLPIRSVRRRLQDSNAVPPAELALYITFVLQRFENTVDLLRRSHGEPFLYLAV